MQDKKPMTISASSGQSEMGEPVVDSKFAGVELKMSSRKAGSWLQRRAARSTVSKRHSRKFRGPAMPAFGRAARISTASSLDISCCTDMGTIYDITSFLFMKVEIIQ